jgi:UDP-N-acetylmuramate--alanine ligase
VADPIDLTTRQRIHIVGAGGAGMSGLAKILAQLGHDVTGSDIKPGRALDALGDVGVGTWVGHRPADMATVDLVVASSAVPDDDPETSAAVAAEVPVWRRPRLLDELTKQMPAIGLTGTHGKTTSSAMAVTALRACGLDPSFIVGGEMVDLNTGAHLGGRDLFVLEADEAYGTFRRLRLNGLLVTNIEADHLDHFGTVAALEDAFAQVAAAVNGPVVGCFDDPGVRRLAQRSTVVSYGTGREATWRIVDLTHRRWAVSFRLEGPGTSVDVEVPKPGTHIARNAAGVLTLLAELGHDIGCAAAGLSRFAGVHRRSEVRAVKHGVTIVDDYAHHPTEVAAMVEAARLGDGGRVWVVFQPHRYTRTADLAPEFGAPLAAADRVVVTDVFSAGEAPIPGVTGRIVAEAVAAAGGRVDYVRNLVDVPQHVVPDLEGGDIVLLLGAGDIATIAQPLADLLER